MGSVGQPRDGGLAHARGIVGRRDVTRNLFFDRRAFLVSYDPDIDPALNLTFNEAQQRKVRVAMSNTFGFGGHNASVIVKKYVA